MASRSPLCRSSVGESRCCSPPRLCPLISSVLHLTRARAPVCRLAAWYPGCPSGPRRYSVEGLHIDVVRPAAALGRDPVDVLVRVFDIACFAMNAVLGVDLVSPAARVLDPLVNPRRAVALRRSAIDVVLGPLLQLHVLDLEVARLILLMVGVGQEHR